MKIIYVLMAISIATMGVVLLKHHYKNLYNRWMGISLIIASMGSFGVSMRTSIVPFLDWAFGLNDSAENVLITISLVALITYFYTLPYFILVSSMFFTELLSEKTRFGLIAILSLPPMFAIAYQLRFISVTELHTEINHSWAPLYLIVALFFHIHTAVTEPSPILKKNKVRIAAVFGFAIVWTGVTDFWDIYLIDAGYEHFQMYSNGLWQFNVFIIAWMVIFFTYYGVRYGFLGIKLRIEQERHDYSMRALMMGTSILNHSLKNEIQKIDYLTERAREAVESGREPVAVQAMESLFLVTDHMMDMVGRIKQKADDIVLQEKFASIQDLIEAMVTFTKPMLGSRNISFELELGKPVVLWCDEVHVREAFHNVMMNAVEAMPPEGGIIRIRVYETKRELVIEVRDSGVGIDKENMAMILEPFFTTKRKPTNYGLGLSYCYAVQQKHGGSLKIDSEKGKGTSVSLRFPAKRKASEGLSRSG